MTPNRTSREILAEIALATDLPIPNSISFTPASGILSLSFTDNLAAAQAWSSHLGGQTTTYVGTNGIRRFLDEGRIIWHGWRVMIVASEPVTYHSEQLPTETTTRLTQLTPR